MNMVLEGGEGSDSRPGRYLLPGKTQYQLYRRLGGPQGQSGQVQKILPPPGFDPQTIQPVASLYTNYATWPTTCMGLCAHSLCNNCMEQYNYVRTAYMQVFLVIF
jgi:hypothetical protein